MDVVKKCVSEHIANTKLGADLSATSTQVSETDNTKTLLDPIAQGVVGVANAAAGALVGVSQGMTGMLGGAIGSLSSIFTTPFVMGAAVIIIIVVAVLLYMYLGKRSRRGGFDEEVLGGRNSYNTDPEDRPDPGLMNFVNNF
jgi:hypothetical protein